MKSKSNPYRLLLVLFVLFWIHQRASAQSVRLRLDGSIEGETFGSSLADIGDVNGDAVPDIAVSAPSSRGKDGSPDGRVLIYSGASGAPLLQLNPIERRGLFGWSIAKAGDIDGDNVPDLIIGAPHTSPDFLFGAGSALIYSGATGDPLLVINGEEMGAYFGQSVAGLGDLDGDGVPDILVGAPYASAEDRIGLGAATVHSGADGTIIFKFNGLDSGDYLGWAVSGLGDIDGDGVPDIMVGAPFASPSGRAQAGSVFVHSGATGDLILQLDGTDARDHFGKSVAEIGDVDGDGTPDLLIGAPNASPDGRENAGSVFLYSGATAKRIFRFDGLERFDEFGASVSSAGDVDGDDVPDILIGAPGASPNGQTRAGSAFVFSGATGELLFRFDGSEQGATLGRSVAGVGSPKDNDRSEAIVGSPYANPQGYYGAGSAFLLSWF